MVFKVDCIMLNSSFPEVVASVEGVDVDSLEALDFKDIVDRFVGAVRKACGVEVVDYTGVMWDYVGGKESDEWNERAVKDVMRRFKDAEGVVVEFAEPDEGNSVFAVLKGKRNAVLGKLIKCLDEFMFTAYTLDYEALLESD